MQTARLLASKFLTFLGEDIPKPLFKALVFGTRDNAPAPPPPLQTPNYGPAYERERLSWPCHVSDSQVKTFGSGPFISLILFSLSHRKIVYLQMRRKCCHCLHIVERFSSWIRMKNSLPHTILSLKNSAYEIRRKKPTKGPTKSLAVITPLNFVNVYLNLHSHWAAFTIHVFTTLPTARQAARQSPRQGVENVSW